MQKAQLKNLKNQPTHVFNKHGMINKHLKTSGILILKITKLAQLLMREEKFIIQ